MPAGAASHAELILTGGRIATLDARSSVVEALAIASGRILATGSRAEIDALRGPGTQCVELRGRTVIPGLVDGHAHMDNEGLKSLYPSLTGCKSIKDIQERIRSLAAKTPPGGWIVTMPIGTPPYYRDGAEGLTEGRYPTRQELDAAAPGHPVYIKPILGYWRGLGGFQLVSVANTRALELAGIGRDTVPPWDGIEIDRDAAGEPTGVFREKTQISVVEMTLMAAAPSFVYADRFAALQRSMAAYAACGTTSVVETHGVMPEVIRTYCAVEQAGLATVRAHLVISPAWSGTPAGDVAAMVRDWYGWAEGRGLGNDMLRVGGLFTRTGGDAVDVQIRARHRDYRNFSGYAPDSEASREVVRELVCEAARNRMRVTTMYLDVLDLFEEANRVRPIVDNRWVSFHIRTLSPEDIRRIRDLGMGMSTQTNRWIADQGSALKARLGPGREDEIVPLRRLKEAGVPFGLGTDNTPISLFHPLWHCVARRNARTGELVAPAQKLSREEALRAATQGGAWLTFEEGVKGSLESGRLADCAVLSEDYFSVPEERIKDITSVLTVVGGRVVHRTDQAA